MRFATLVFKPGYGGFYEGPGPNFATLDYVMPQRYGTIHSSMVPDLYYEDTPLKQIASAWQFRVDMAGNNMQERILQECEVIHVVVRVDWNE